MLTACMVLLFVLLDLGLAVCRYNILAATAGALRPGPRWFAVPMHAATIRLGTKCVHGQRRRLGRHGDRGHHLVGHDEPGGCQHATHLARRR